MEELKLFQELKDNAYEMEGNSIGQLKKMNKIYDIDPVINNTLLENLLDNKMKEDFKNQYIMCNQILSLNQKLKINEKMGKFYPKIKKEIEKKVYINNKSYVEIYFKIIKIIYSDNKLEFSNLKKIFETKYFVDNSKIKIPIIYGTNELKYSGLINNLYQYFFVYDNEPEIFSKEIKSLDKSIISKNYPEEIIIKNVPMELEEEYKISKNDNKKRKENIIIDNKTENRKKKRLFKNKIKLIYPILEKIFDNDDFFDIFKVEEYYKYDDIDKFKKDYKLKPNLDELYFHLLFLDFILCIHVFCKEEKLLTPNIIQMFFEFKKIKLRILQDMSDDVIFKTKNKEIIKFNNVEDIKNEEYLIYDIDDENNEEKSFLFNPYHYILENINYNDFQSLKNEFNNEKNFTLLKYYKMNSFSKNQNMNNLFENNIKSMLKSKISNYLFSESNLFSSFSYPYNGQKCDKFIEQVFNIILYFPFPSSKISGFTYKSFGLIFINNKKEEKRIIPTTLFLFNSCKLALKKLTFNHEIISHYSCSICHANNEESPIKTLSNSFKDYWIKNEYIGLYETFDDGDRGEVLNFRNKIKILFIIGAKFILNNDNWNNFNDIENFKNSFIKSNKFIDENNKFIGNNILKIKDIRKDDLLNELLIGVESDEIKLTINNSVFAFRTLMDGFEE